MAQRSDADPTGWRRRARDPKNWNAKTLAELTQSAPIEEGSLSLVLAVAERLQRAGGKPIPFLTKVQVAFPNDFWANYVLANMLGDGRTPEDAIAYYEAALHIRPQTSSVYNNLGLALMNARRWEEAVENFQKAVDLDPSNTAAYGNVGVIWSFGGQHDKAIERLKEAVGRKPEFAGFHDSLAQLRGQAQVRGGQLALSTRPRACRRRPIARDAPAHEAEPGVLIRNSRIAGTI